MKNKKTAMTEAKLAKYLAYPQECASCGSQDLDGGVPDFDSATEISVHTKCNACGTEYDEIYRIARVNSGDLTVGK